MPRTPQPCQVKKSSHSDKQSLANLPKSPASFESAKKILYKKFIKGMILLFIVVVIMTLSQKLLIGKAVVIFHVKMPSVPVA
jgi:hypothetical protein